MFCVMLCTLIGIIIIIIIISLIGPGADESACKCIELFVVVIVVVFCCCCYCCCCGGGGENARGYIVLSHELHAIQVHGKLKLDTLFNPALLERDLPTSASTLSVLEIRASVTRCVANPA
jgi:Na+/melibiose symporter-like transporter